jgi:hypothetical protein
MASEPRQPCAQNASGIGGFERAAEGLDCWRRPEINRNLLGLALDRAPGMISISRPGRRAVARVVSISAASILSWRMVLLNSGTHYLHLGAGRRSIMSAAEGNHA